MAARNRWMAGVGLLVLMVTFMALAPMATVQAGPAGDEPKVTKQVEPAAPSDEASPAAADDESASGVRDGDAAAYIAKANEELLKLKDLDPASPQAQEAILQAYKLVAHGFHQFPRDPAMTVAYAAMKPVQLFRHFGWRIQGFLIHSPLDYRRYKNTVRRSYEQWRVTGNKSGMAWIHWFSDSPADAAYDVENNKFSNSKEFALFPNGEKLQEWLAADVFPEMENIAQALEANVVKRQEDFNFNWDLRAGFSNWAAPTGALQPADESPVKRIGRSEGLILAAMYRSWIGWTKVFCSYNFNSFFKVRSRFNEGKAFTELAEIVKQFTLPDLFKLWNKNDGKGILDGRAFIKSSQADLLTSLQILEELNSEQFAKGDENPAGRWFDYNVMKPWSGRIANLINEMRALLSGSVMLEDSWNKTRTAVNVAGWFDNPPPDLTIFLPSKISSNRNVSRYVPFFDRIETRGVLAKEFGVDLRHLLSPRQNIDLLDLNMHVDWQPTNDPGEWRDYSMYGLFPGAKDRVGLLKGVYTVVNSRSSVLTGGVWGLVFGTLFWTN
ncbi:MAG: hypothetical protein HY814_04700 [Candidatus Riflebacteria bacterium]|nr:hypothetical protein [Candidatus Riflebacteria bacterium]